MSVTSSAAATSTTGGGFPPMNNGGCASYGTTSTVTGTALPTGLACTDGCFGGIGPAHAVAAGPIDDQTWPRILSCCGSKPIVVQSNGCFAWCQADEGQLQSLWNCYYEADGTLSSGFAETAANACDDQSSSSPLGFFGSNLTCKAAAVSSSTSVSSATLSATASATHTGAAVALRPRSVGKMEIAVGSLVMLSLLTGALL